MIQIVDLLDDGFVNQRDFIISKFFDKDKDGKLNSI